MHFLEGEREREPEKHLARRHSRPHSWHRQRQSVEAVCVSLLFLCSSKTTRKKNRKAGEKWGFLSPTSHKNKIAQNISKDEDI